MDPTHWSISTFSTNNLSDLFAIFHHASKCSTMWSCRRDITKRVQSCKLNYWTCFVHGGHLDFNPFHGFLNCSIDFKNILNCLISWDIDYTQACTTPILKIKTARVNTSDFYISLQQWLQASSQIIYIEEKLKRFNSIVLVKCHPELPGCGVSRTTCTAPWIAHIGKYKWFQRRKEA
jgi:hypothetical protein